MPSYNCEKCGKTFPQKSNYTFHINKKNSCTKDYKCNNCNKSYKFLSGISRHKKECKMKEKSIQKKPKEKQIINNEINIINNINNTHNNNTNIYILPYNGKDKIKLSEESYLKILNNGSKYIPKLIEESHFNKEQPEYHNIYIPNIKEKYVLVYTGIEWEIKNSDEILDEIINYKIDELEGKFDDIINELPENIVNKFKKFIYEKEEDTTINMIKKYLKILLYNKRHIPLETRKKLASSDKNDI